MMRWMPALALPLLLCSSGCHVMSDACFRLGHIVRPEESCELCGGLDCVCPPHDPLIPPIVGGIPGGDLQSLESLHVQVAELTDQYEMTRTELAQMRQELYARNQQLIETRAHLASMEKQLGGLQSQLGNWTDQVARLENTLQEQSQQRADLIEKLTESLARLADQHETATSQMVMDAIRR